MLSARQRARAGDPERRRMMADEAQSSIKELIKTYHERPTTIYVRLVLLFGSIAYNYLLFGKQLNPTRDLYKESGEKFVSRWKNVAFGFQIIVAFIPLLGVGTVAPFLVARRETADEARKLVSPGAASFGARVAPYLAILSVETAIGVGVVGVGMSVANLAMRLRCFWAMLGLSLMNVVVHAAFFCAVALIFEDLSWLSVTHILTVLAEVKASGYAITPAYMKSRGKWFTYLSSLRYAYDAECRLCAGQWYPEAMEFQRGAGEHWNNVPFDFGMLALFWLFWVLFALALAHRRFGARGGDEPPAGYGALDDRTKSLSTVLGGESILA